MLRRLLCLAALVPLGSASLALATTVDYVPLLAPYTGPYGGGPAFDKIGASDFKPAIAKAMDDFRRELAMITGRKEPANFQNTIAALEDAGRAYSRATILLGVYTSTMNDPAMQAVEKDLAPILAAFEDEITQNEALFARIKTVYEARQTAHLTAEENRLVEVIYRDLARRGATLGAAQKLRLRQINKELATLYTNFSQNLLFDEDNDAVTLSDPAELSGLPESLKASARSAAEAKGLKGKWRIANTRSAAEPFLTYSTKRALREKVWRMWTSRGEHAGPKDNKPIIAQILSLRAERAKLLGFSSHAHWILDDNMARTPDAAMALMMRVWKAAVARAKEEIADMQKVADAEKAGHSIEPWDYRFYAEKVRKAKYDLDQNEVKSYLQLDKMREAMFWVAQQSFGLEFRPISGMPVYHPDVTAYEVRRDGQRVGLWYFDPYAREGKHSGAWMNEYRQQETFAGVVTPIVSNNSNFVKGPPGTPVLISWDDAQTLFHEFGHALHGLNSNVKYPRLAGTSTLRDFVEFPSQLLEHFLPTPEVLSKFALHYKTGKTIPAELVAKIQKAKNFNQGFHTVEYLYSAIYDMKVHTAPTVPPIDASAFEKQVAKEIGAPSEIVMRHRPTQFGHIFGGDGYSAGYYSYIWADTLTADAAEAFVEAGGLYDSNTSRRLRSTIFSVGNSVAPEVAFKQFRGRDVDTDALMRDRGFPLKK